MKNEEKWRKNTKYIQSFFSNEERTKLSFNCWDEIEDSLVGVVAICCSCCPVVVDDNDDIVMIIYRMFEEENKLYSYEMRRRISVEKEKKKRKSQKDNNWKVESYVYHLKWHGINEWWEFLIGWFIGWLAFRSMATAKWSSWVRL